MPKPLMPVGDSPILEVIIKQLARKRFSRRVLDFIPEDQAYGFDQPMLRFRDEKRDVSVQTHEGYWLDIGRPDDYFRAVDEWPDLRTKLGL